MFNRLIEPTKGEILLDDKSIKDYDLRKLREKTGYVLQTASLFPNLTVGENITIVLEQEGVSRKERRKKQEELLKSVGLDPVSYTHLSLITVLITINKPPPIEMMGIIGYQGTTYGRSSLGSR